MLHSIARSLAAVCLFICTAVHAENVLVLRGATVYVDPQSAPLHDTNVVIRDGKIAAVGGEAPAGARELDCRGLVVVAGLHNSHVHFMGPEWAGAAQLPAEVLAAQLQAMLTRYGFTSVFDTGSRLDDTLALRKRIEAGEVAGPRILTAGEPLFPPDGLPIYLRGLPPDLLALMKEPATPQEAIAAVDSNLDRGADAVRLSGSSLESGLLRIEVAIEIAGQRVVQSLPALPSQTVNFTWNGKDRFDRPVQGSERWQVEVSHVYPSSYFIPAPDEPSFLHAGGVILWESPEEVSRRCGP